MSASLGNILGDRVQNGTTSIDIQTPSGNANITVAGTSNVAVFSTAGANITGTLGVTGNITGGNLSGTSIVGTLLTAAQTNITSVGTLGSLTVTGNISGGNILGGANVNATTHTGTTVSVTANITGGNILTGGIVSATGNITSAGNITGGNVLGGANVNATTHTGTTVSVTANITGGNILTGGIVSATGNVTGGNISTGGQFVSTIATGTAPMVVASTTKVTNLNVEQVDGFHADQAGTVSTIVVRDASGYANVAGLINSGANGVGNIGSSTTYFNTVFAKATSAQYADLAEKYVADADYPAGTVVVFGGDKEVTVTSVDADRAVAGVVSTNPSYIMNGGLEAEFVATVALTGRVPTRVTGKVNKGDLMVSAGYGLARAEQDPKVGTVIGKALENFEGNEGVIEVVVGRF